MARKRTSRADVLEQLAADERPSKRNRWNGLDRTELIAAVCHYLCRGHTATEIAELMHKEYGVDMKREMPYRLVVAAGSYGWLLFSPPHEYALQKDMRARYPGLHGVRVVHTAVSQDVAHAGAELLFELVQQYHRPPVNKAEVHIGFAGGHSMRELARRFAVLLRQPVEGLPDKVIFHAMVAGFDVTVPTTDPNAFFTYFEDRAMHVKTGFVTLHAPAVVRAGQFPELRKLKGIKEAYDRVHELDIIVSSASAWADEDSVLRHHMSLSEESLSELEKAGCVGDMLWRPIGPTGPIKIKTSVRAMTIMDLEEVSKFVGAGKQVLLVTGPCGACGRLKTEVVSAILDQKERLITHLVADSRCVRELLVPR